jgi:hypothetical protein
LPTLPKFEESRNRLPEAPPATDISAERFGKDAAALAQFGGELGQLGGKLMQARKQAIESDAVANAQTNDLIEFSTMEDEERAAYQKDISAPGVDVSQVSSMSDRLKTRMEKSIEARSKGMPTGDAQREYLQRITPVATRSYLGNVDWENKTRTGAILGNMETKGNLVSQSIAKNPSLARAMDHISALKADVAAKTGTIFDNEQAQKAYKVLGKNYAVSLFEGLANGTAADSKYGRELAKNMPPEMAALFDAGDVDKIDKRFDQADRERKQQFDIDKAAKKEALQLQRDKAQDAILADIYEGKSNVRDIIHGKGAILDPDKKQQMLGILKQRQFEPKIPAPAALKDVIGRIHAEPGDPKRIASEDQLLNVYNKGGMTYTQLNQARKELRDLSTPQGQVEGDLKKQLFTQAKKALTGKNAMEMVDPDGEEQYAKFMAYAYDRIENAKKNGENVRDLLDANSKNYIGNAIKNFQKSPQQVMKAQVDKLKFAAMAKKAANEPLAPQPKGTVLMLDPAGKKFYVPEANAQKAAARGFKPAEAKRK